MQHYEKASRVMASAQELFEWHARPGALARLLPPWQAVEVEAAASRLEVGSRVCLRLGLGPFRRTWIAEHTAVMPGRGFEDIQRSGPFKHWHHRHRFAPAGVNLADLRDSIDYALPLGAIGQGLVGRFVRRSLGRMFEYRHRTTEADLALHSRFRDKARLRVAVSGAGGLIGSALTAMLTTGGHEVVHLTRSPQPHRREGVLWDPARGLLESAGLEGLDAVVHLAGDPIVQGRWTGAKKESIRRSRIQGTQQLVESLSRLSRPPKTFLSASAVGIYGDRGDETLTEESTPGGGFLAEVCKGWEKSAQGATVFGARTVSARFGVVLSPRGGALAKMLPVFRLGGGGRLGSGRQFLSWVSVDDAAAALIHILMTPDLSGPVNITSPEPVTNGELTQALGGVLKRPTVMLVPAPLARLLFGEMADETLLASNRVLPEKLLASGFEFRHGDLPTALAHLLGRAES